MLKETTRKILEGLFSIDPWFLKTTPTNFFLFFLSHSYSNSRRCLWDDHQWRIFWLLIILLNWSLFFTTDSPLTPPNEKYEERHNYRKSRLRWRWIWVLSKMIIITSMFHRSCCRSCWNDRVQCWEIRVDYRFPAICFKDYNNYKCTTHEGYFNSRDKYFISSAIKIEKINMINIIVFGLPYGEDSLKKKKSVKFQLP